MTYVGPLILTHLLINVPVEDVTAYCKCAGLR
jgi:hypothetical protein